MATDLRETIQRLIHLAEANRFEQNIDRNQALHQMARHTLVIENIHIRYIQHILPDITRVLAHLSLHGPPSMRFDEAYIDQVAEEFGFGPRAEWHLMLVDRPPTPSVHIFKFIPT